jgi:hypothetical protein
VVAALIAVAALAGTLFLYHEAIGLPFFFDDMIHLRWLDWHALPSIWTTAEGLGYYRPLTMSVWKVDGLLFGDNDPGRLHSLSLMLHALNSVLAAGIAWRALRGKGKAIYALLVALFFVSYPFSYQAVPSTSSLSKPLIATLTLASVLLYWEARRRHSAWLTALSVLAAFLAPFAYETGVMVPLAILAVEVLGKARQEFDRLHWLPILFVVLVWGIALPVVVLLEPETGASLGLPSLHDLWHNGVYFLQGLIFPIAPVATPLGGFLLVDEYILLAAIELGVLGGLLLFYRWVRRMDVFWYALSWYVVAVLPLWFMLDFSYVITSPRILYLGAMGSALLWAGMPILLWLKFPTRWWSRMLAVATVLAVLLFNTAYVRQKMELAEEVAGLLWQAVQIAEEEGPSASLLYLNVPVWVAPKEATYRVGTEGLTFIPDYVRVQDFVYVNAGQEPAIGAWMFDPAKRDWRAYIGYAGDGLDWDGLAQQIRQADGVYLPIYPADGLRFVEAGALEKPGSLTGSDAAPARFGDGIDLVKHVVRAADGELTVHLWWHAQDVPEQDMTVFLHVYNGAGQLVAQADGYPLLGLYPPSRWQAGDLVRDVRRATLPESAVEGSYTLAVGWYDPATGQRLPAFDQQGEPVANDAVQLYP